MLEIKWFLTVDWCKQGKRGLFTDPRGKGYWLPEPYTEAEMHDILGVFWMILSPMCLPFTEEEMKSVSEWYSLDEYNDQFGYAVIPKNVLANITRRRGAQYTHEVSV